MIATVRRLGVIALVLVFVASLQACATDSAARQRRQCRRMRGAAAARGIGLALGAVVLVGVVVVAAAGGGNPNFGGGGSGSRAERRQRRRAARAAACRRAHELERQEEEGVVAQPSPNEMEAETESDEAATVDLPLESDGHGPPSFAELEEAIAPHVEALRTCNAEAEGTLYLDARLSGETGRVTGIVLSGPIADHIPTECVSTVTARIETRRFPGTVDVRWAVRYPR